MKKLVIYLSMLVATTNCIAQKTKLFADSILTNYHIPEISYAVINANKTIEIAALGKHAIHLKDTATLNDRFHIGSNTKAMTAFVIAKYIELGKLKWTTKFFDLFPEWKEKSKADYADITLQDLLSHKAGIQPFQGNAGFNGEDEIEKIGNQFVKVFNDFLLFYKTFNATNVIKTEFEKYSAKEVTRILAEKLDEVN